MGRVLFGIVTLVVNQLKKIEIRLSAWTSRHPSVSGILATTVGLLVVSLLLLTNSYLNKQAETKELAADVKRIENNVEEIFHNCELAAISLSHAVDANGQVHDFDSIAAHIIQTSGRVDILELVPNGVIEYAYPLDGNESVIGYDILADSKVNKEAELAIAKNEMYYAGPIELKQGGMAVIGRLPLFRNGKFWGFSAVLIHLDNFMNYAGLNRSEDTEFMYQLSKIDPNSGIERNFLKEQACTGETLVQEVTTFPEGQWKVHVMKEKDNSYVFSTWVILIVGFLISNFLGIIVAVHLKRSDELATAHKKLGWQFQEITDSIHSAKYLQMSVLQGEGELKSVFPESFMLFRPKDQVSGDFFWSYQTEKHRIVAVIDCTGHGVSAALMSMIACEMLHRAVVVDGERSPAKVLSYMDQHLLQVLQNGSNLSMDGMDAVLCVLENESNKVVCSAANRPLYVARDGKIEERKGTRSTIGGYRNGTLENQYDQFEFDAGSGDMIYLTSDGYHSQFGGELGKTMGKRAFRHLLESVSMLPAERQLALLTEDLERWQGEEDQVDDILVVGMRLALAV